MTAHRPALIAVAAAAVTAASVGCAGPAVRRVYITSDPAGARVVLNDVDVGRTPVEVDFTWFGVYDVRLRLEGHEPLVAAVAADPPLHEQPGFDLIAMALPGREVTELRWHFDLEPARGDADALLARAVELQRREAEDAAGREAAGETTDDDGRPDAGAEDDGSEAEG